MDTSLFLAIACVLTAFVHFISIKNTSGVRSLPTKSHIRERGVLICDCVWVRHTGTVHFSTLCVKLVRYWTILDHGEIMNEKITRDTSFTFRSYLHNYSGVTRGNITAGSVLNGLGIYNRSHTAAANLAVISVFMSCRSTELLTSPTVHVSLRRGNSANEKILPSGEKNTGLT